MNRRSLIRNLTIAGAGSFSVQTVSRTRCGPAAGFRDPRSEVRLVLLDVSVK
jgi:hypothetical protein